MINISNILNDNAPQDLRDFVSSCKSDTDFFNKLENDPTRVFGIFQHMNEKGNEFLAGQIKRLAARKLYQIPPAGLQDQTKFNEAKSVETALRNRGLLNRSQDPNITFKWAEGTVTKAHRSILALESSHLRTMTAGQFSEREMTEIELRDERINPEAYTFIVDYLYLSDEGRKEAVSKADKALLPSIVVIADAWGLDALKKDCDEELCNSIAEVDIGKNDIPGMVAQPNIPPKFKMLLQFVQKASKGGEIDPIIEKMQTPKGAAELAAQCTPDEIAAFATLKTEFGKACQIPPGTFGKTEWEKAFPVRIEEVPPLPANIHAVLEMEDPYEPGKKLKDTCTLFLRPKEVVLLEEGGEKKLPLTFDGAEELAQKATNPERRTNYRTFQALRDQLNGMPVAESGWVLMRNEVIPGTRNKNFENQKSQLKEGFEVPKVMDAVLLNILTFAAKGERLYGNNPWTYTRCQEQCNNYQTCVGGFDSYGLYVSSSNIAHDINGLSGAWKL